MSAALQILHWPAVNRLEAALMWLRLGAAVFPLHLVRPSGQCSCGRDGCGSPGKHPIAKAAPRGVHDASRDSDAVAAWWTRYPEANIGVAAGEVSGFVVLDVDPRHGGDDKLRALETEHGTLPDTPEQHTGGGGRHLFFAYDPQLRNSAGRLGEGLDIKSDGGYVVGAGPNHASGGVYTHDAMFSLGDLPLAPYLETHLTPRPCWSTLGSWRSRVKASAMN
jgi:hypothetical protein